MNSNVSEKTAGLYISSYVCLMSVLSRYCENTANASYLAVFVSFVIQSKFYPPLESKFFPFLVVSIVLLVIKRFNTNHYEKRFSLRIWCSNVACHADIESYTYQKVEGTDLEMTNCSTKYMYYCSLLVSRLVMLHNSS